MPGDHRGGGDNKVGRLQVENVVAGRGHDRQNDLAGLDVFGANVGDRRMSASYRPTSADPPLGFGDRDADVLVVARDHGDPLEVDGFATDFGLGSLGVGGRVVGDHHAGPDVVVDRGPERPGAQRERDLAAGAGQDAAPRRLPFDLVAEGYRFRMVARAAAYGAICCSGTGWTRSWSTSALSR